MNAPTRKARRGHWSVKEFYQLTEEQFEMTRRFTPPGNSVTTGGSCVHTPHLFRWMAWIELGFRKLFVPSNYGILAQYEVVNHDAEMRKWGRYDFLDHPTDEDLARTLAGAGFRIEPDGTLSKTEEP